MIVRVNDLPQERIDFIREGYSSRKAAYICSTLTSDELFVIDGTRGLARKDYLALAKTKRILEDPFLVEHIDSEYLVKGEFYRDYLDRQADWMQHEWDLLAFGLHERGEQRELTQREFYDDFQKHRNGQRFKIFYALSFPHRMQRKE